MCDADTSIALSRFNTGKYIAIRADGYVPVRYVVYACRGEEVFVFGLLRWRSIICKITPIIINIRRIFLASRLITFIRMYTLKKTRRFSFDGSPLSSRSIEVLCMFSVRCCNVVRRRLATAVNWFRQPTGAMSVTYYTGGVGASW